MKSIRARLFTILLVTTGIVWLSAIAWIYLSTKAQVERVLDARLTEAARMVGSLVSSQDIAIGKAGAAAAIVAVPHASYDRQLSCQIWGFDGTLVGRSESAPGKPLTLAKSGFSETSVDGETWRVYAVTNPELGIRVLVGDNLRVRDRLVADVIRGLAFPALLILPVLAALLWLSVGRGLAPLNAMASALGARRASDLSALPDNDSPSEIKPVIHSLNGLFARVSTVRERERDFTAFAAHELRTPIAGLKTQAQIALGSSDDSIRNNALRQITVAVDRTARLVRQLTDLTNAESGELEDDVGHVDVGRTLQTLADDIGQHHRNAASVLISAELARLELGVNPSLFMAGARNLLENAVLHSPPDKPVRCGLRQEQRFLAITIDDCGPGIPEDELPKVRGRFFRGRNQTAAGSGLGLVIAELAAERMGAVLHLENRAEGGLRAELQFAERAIADGAA
ncbi:MAG: sensor histidine kinase N-terminal domain-containing protein [Hyphomicrobiales bacterium]|nr:sensor histidine kinase N-terminal domain-containing protein [Hyphomicrobiales bacterium]